MEEDARALLSAVNALCEGAGWRLLDEAELSESLPQVPPERVAAAMEKLAAMRLVDVRYAEGGTYCVRPTPAGRAYAARLEEDAAAARRRERRMFYAAFWGGLAGAFFGAALVLLFSLLW